MPNFTKMWGAINERSPESLTPGCDLNDPIDEPDEPLTSLICGAHLGH